MSRNGYLGASSKKNLNQPFTPATWISYKSYVFSVRLQHIFDVVFVLPQNVTLCSWPFDLKCCLICHMFNQLWASCDYTFLRYEWLNLVTFPSLVSLRSVYVPCQMTNRNIIKNNARCHQKSCSNKIGPHFSNPWPQFKWYHNED